jgi:hypothetical protein
MLRGSGRATIFAAATIALIFSLTAPSAAGAFGISSFSVTPSTTQAGGHPDTAVSLSFTGPGTVRDLTLDLPPGMIGNPETKTKCSQAAFQADRCPGSSAVGTVRVIASALGILSIPVPGTVYVLEPAASDAATLGIVARATGNLPIVGKIFSIAHFSAVRNSTGDYFLRSSITGLPNTARAVLGLVPVPMVIRQLTLNLKAPGNTAGTFFMTNPTGCQTATSAVQATSDGDDTAGAQSSFTPTDCAAVPFSPTFDLQASSTQAGARAAPTATITVPGNENPIRQSHVKNVVLRFPPGMMLDILAAFGVPTCSDANFAADACPAGSDIGNVRVAVPPLPPDFTGDVYRVSPSGSDSYGFGVVLRGPRGLKATVRGGGAITSVLTPAGYVVQIVSTFPFLPEIPFTSFQLAITLPFFFNPQSCGTQNAEAALGGWSGATANLTTPYTTTGC